MRRNPFIPLVLIGLIITAAIAMSQRQATSSAGGSANAQGTPVPGAVAEVPAELLPTPTMVPLPEPTATHQPIPTELQAQIDLIEAETAGLRGLDPMDNVPETFMTRPQFREYYKKEMMGDVSLDEVQAYLQELWLLRLLGTPNIDYYDVSADAYSDNILGFYDHRKKELFVITDKLHLDAEAQVTLAHEYVHTLQDQHYKLKKLWPTESTDWDKSMAIRSLVEGDATLSGYAWAAYFMNRTDLKSMFENQQLSPEVAQETPSYFSLSLYFPYIQGTEFVSKIMEVGSFSTVNLSLQDPPRSTEQIMHPEKFLQTPIDQPKYVTVPDLMPALGEPWELKETNTLGEFEFHTILEQNGASDPDRGADGWGGAKFAYYRLAQEGLVYANTVWDTAQDAQEFYGAMYESFAKVQKDGDYWTDGGRTFWMRWDGKKVIVVASTNRPALERVVATVR